MSSVLKLWSGSSSLAKEPYCQWRQCCEYFTCYSPRCYLFHLCMYVPFCKCLYQKCTYIRTQHLRCAVRCVFRMRSQKCITTMISMIILGLECHTHIISAGGNLKQEAASVRVRPCHIQTSKSITMNTLNVRFILGSLSFGNMKCSVSWGHLESILGHTWAHLSGAASLSSVTIFMVLSSLTAESPPWWTQGYQKAWCYFPNLANKTNAKTFVWASSSDNPFRAKTRSPVSAPTSQPHEQTCN